MAFGECPECGKMTLIEFKERDWRGGDCIVHKVKCVNPECDFEKEIGCIAIDAEDEDIEDDDKEEEEEEF